MRKKIKMLKKKNEQSFQVGIPRNWPKPSQTCFRRLTTVRSGFGKPSKWPLRGLAVFLVKRALTSGISSQLITLQTICMRNESEMPTWFWIQMFMDKLRLLYNFQRFSSCGCFKFVSDRQMIPQAHCLQPDSQYFWRLRASVRKYEAVRKYEGIGG